MHRRDAPEDRMCGNVFGGFPRVTYGVRMCGSFLNVYQLFDAQV